ncbi:hypothetical protein CICLE_v10003886mg [Citrus x clementina]|uniref:Protein NRT1/ PTR FAMILY 5.8 n=2 Tax=Citrus TaxID=2706 RepID=A0ACB8KHX4_CITSI|nr:hypothetical protein CICLE_v10003886mg [Citrus x clementina]KAH9753916.1 protein NRT1/ PTR FAMILY 5.8 [Citrus sinensis]
MGLCKSCLMLIVIAGKERFAFKGVASNLVTYLTDVMKMSNSSAAKTVSSWNGLTSMLPLLLAPLADSYWDRHSTILAFSFIYVLGLMALTSTAFAWAESPANTTSCSSFLFLPLSLISLGLAGYNPSLQAFGADQMDNNNDDEEILPCTLDNQNKKSNNNKSLFFKWWYFGVCSGSLLGITLMSYIQDTFGWVIGFAIPTIAMLTSTAFFSFASRFCKKKSDHEALKNKPFMSIVQAIKAAASKLKNSKAISPIDKSDAMELELQEKPLCCNDQNKELDDELENPKNVKHAVQNVKILLRLLPIWTMLLMFAVIFQQPVTFFTKQGMAMKRNIGSRFKIPPATLQSAITVSIILLMPLYDTVLIPIIQIITCYQFKKGISVMQRMGIGMFLTSIAMVIAAAVETKRLQRSKQAEAKPITIFWLLPEYVLLGISDIFTVVAMQEFFYNEVSVRMRTMGFALYTSVFGVGSFLSALLISVIEFFTSSRARQSWFSDDMTQARMNDIIFFF